MGQSHDLPTSLTLLERVKNRDGDAWQRLVFLYGPIVKDWCGRWSLASHDRDDIVQDVFQAVVQKIDDFRRQRPDDKFRKWLWTITRNKVCDSFRKKQGETPQGGSQALERLNQVPEECPDSDVETSRATDELVQRSLQLIRPEYSTNVWQMFWRSAIDGHETRDIAADFGVTPTAVRVAKSRVLKRLRLELGDDFETPK